MVWTCFFLPQFMFSDGFLTSVTALLCTCAESDSRLQDLTDFILLFLFINFNDLRGDLVFLILPSVLQTACSMHDDHNHPEVKATDAKHWNDKEITSASMFKKLHGGILMLFLYFYVAPTTTSLGLWVSHWFVLKDIQGWSLCSLQSLFIFQVLN